MKRTILAFGVCMLCATLRADWTVLRDFNRGETPNEVHENIRGWLTAENVRPGQVGFAIHPRGRGWVTRYRLWHNWTWYDRVAFCMFNANDKPVTIQFEVRTHHQRRAKIDFTVKPGPNDVALRFTDFENIGEKPFSLWDVSQWVFFFSDATEKPLTLSELRLIRENIQLPRPTEGGIGKSWTGDGAALASREEKRDPVPEFWADVTYLTGMTSAVWLDLRAGDKKFNTFELNSNWLGYDRLTFDCENPGKEPVTFEVVFEDFTTFACRDTEFRPGQAFVIPMTAKSGKQTLSVDLTKLKTVDGKRWFDPTQVCRVGFRVSDAKAGMKLAFADLRVRTSDEMAGVLVPQRHGLDCVRCGERLDDRNGNCCPFCGKFYNAEPVATPPAAGSVTLIPVKDASTSASSGGGGPTVNQADRRSSTLSVHHYDVSFWEGRAFLRFDPSATAIDPAEISKAELRLSSTIAGKQGKSWLCPVRVFVAPDGHDDFEEDDLQWINQPPIGGFASVGGLYYYRADKMGIDVTDFLKARLARTKGSFTLILRAFEAEPCKTDAHLFGHHFPFYSKDQGDESKRPRLYIELK